MRLLTWIAVKRRLARFIRHEPHGVVLTVAAWNYPFLIAVNSRGAGDHGGQRGAAQTLRTDSPRRRTLRRVLRAAGLPAGVFQMLHLTHADTERLVGDRRIGCVAFTGSVAGGTAVQRAAANRFIPIGLELGGNDPAYVREDVNLAHAVENLVDGAFFNSGQSCCGIGRIYVHRPLYAPFVEAHGPHPAAQAGRSAAIRRRRSAPSCVRRPPTRSGGRCPCLLGRGASR